MHITPTSAVLQQQSGILRAPLIDSGGQTGRHRTAHFVRNQGHLLAPLHTQARPDGVSRARHQLCWCFSK